MEKTTCPLCGRQSAILVEGHVEHWHCGVCHREWPKGDGILSEDVRWKDDDGEIRH
jgi:ribosomal protein L37AE/L43A